MLDEQFAMYVIIIFSLIYIDLMIKNTTNLIDNNNLFKNASHIPSYISYLISNAKACNPVYRNAVLLGTVIDCSLRLRKGIGKSYVENAKVRVIFTIC
jgi:hypothetical protein